MDEEGGEAEAEAVAHGPQREVCEGSACPGARRKLDGRRRLTGHSSLTWNWERQSVVIRVEGPSDCESSRPYDPCFGQTGSFGVRYAPPPSPPPPSPPLPPPPPPHPPPTPPPPYAPLAFDCELEVEITAAAFGNETLLAFEEAMQATALLLPCFYYLLLTYY